MSESGQSSATDPGPAGDQSATFYLARFQRVPASIGLEGGERQIRLSGEILVTGQLQDRLLIVQEVRRVSVWSDLIEELGSMVALAGPVREVAPDPGVLDVRIPFDMRLYYSLLGQLKPVCTESDAFYPAIEMLAGQLALKSEPAKDPSSARLEVALILDQLVDSYIGAVKTLVVEPVVLTFHPLTEQPNIESEHSPLVACLTAAPAGTDHEQIGLRLRFINLSRLESDVEAVAQELIEGACRVWWQKGGIRIDPESAITRPTTAAGTFQNPNGSPGFYVGAAQVNDLLSLGASSGRIEVYFVDTIGSDLSTGGGIAQVCGSFDAFVILEVGQARNNRYLLAHELAHVLGMRHPGPAGSSECEMFPEGSICSVMVPDRPNSSRNTLNNITTAIVRAFPWGPLVRYLGSVGGWAYDADQGFFSIVRDFPYDDGTEASVPESPFTDWWSNSDVWCTPGTPMFAPDYSPLHTEPSYMGSTNLCVRLHTCQPLASNVNVYFYLASPGVSVSMLTPITSPLTFSVGGLNPLKPGSPSTKSVSLSLPSGAASHSCIFAVAVNATDPAPVDVQSIISNPTGDNDVAQRNIHIQGVPPGMEMRTMTAWIEMTNPLDQVMSASLRVDTTQAARLEELLLEVNGQLSRQIEVGQLAEVPLTDALGTNDRLILRFRARLPEPAVEGSTFPINVQLRLDQQLMSGYKHVIQVVPFPRALAQVLDLLYGALIGVAVGCKVDAAQTLAEHIREIALSEETKGPRLWDVIRRWIGFPLHNWATRLTRLAPQVGALADSLASSAKRSQEVDAIRQHLYQLAGLLMNARQSTSAERLIEDIRDVADRIQQLTGDLVAMQRKPVASVSSPHM